MSYWNDKGTYQDLLTKYEALIPMRGKVQTPHLELLCNARGVYYDVMNNGNTTWYAIVQNNRIHRDYVPPHDAPLDVHDLFECINSDYELYEKHIRNMDEDEEWEEPEDVLVFTDDILDRMMDSVLIYVDKKENQVNE